MPTPVVRPTNYPIPFANSGAKNAIPTTGNNVSAGFDTGFPPVTMLPLTAGGVPPQGKDFNGILYDVTTHTVWVNAGGQYQFDAALSTAIGGYPAGMVLQSNDGLKSYVSAVNNNTTDFNATPSSIGSAWLPWSGGAISNVSIPTTGGVTVLTNIQAQARIISVTGVLVSDATLTFPAALGRWTIVNNTTGNFKVTAIALGGAGVPILQGAADTVYCDATNIKYANASNVTQSFGTNSKAIATMEAVQQAIAGVGGYLSDTGVANAYVVAFTPAIVAYPPSLSFKIKIAHANTLASTLDAGAGAIPLVREDGSPVQAGDLFGLVDVQYDQATNKFWMIGLAISQLGAIAKLNVGTNLVSDGVNLNAADQGAAALFQLGLAY